LAAASQSCLIVGRTLFAQSCEINGLALLPQVVAVNSDHLTGQSHTDPEHQRNHCDRPGADPTDGRIGQRCAAVNREVKYDRGNQKRHLDPEERSVVALARFGSQNERTAGEQDDQPGLRPAIEFAGNARHRMAPDTEAEQRHIDHEHRACQQHEPDQVDDFSQRDERGVTANGLGKLRVAKPVEERKYGFPHA